MIRNTYTSHFVCPPFIGGDQKNGRIAHFVPRSLKEIESMNVDDDDDDSTSVYSYRSTSSNRSNVSELTLPNSLRNTEYIKNSASSIIQSVLEETYEEEEEDDDYIELTEDNPEFMLFKEEVKQWLLLDDDIRVLNKALTERKKKKNEITPRILEFMGKYEIENLNTQEGKVQYTKSQITKPMNKEYIKTRLSEFMRNVEKAEKCTNYLLANRIKEEKVSLRRVMNK
jgi:hypothetical protein